MSDQTVPARLHPSARQHRRTGGRGSRGGLLGGVASQRTNREDGQLGPAQARLRDWALQGGRIRARGHQRIGRADERARSPPQGARPGVPAHRRPCRRGNQSGRSDPHEAAEPVGAPARQARAAADAPARRGTLDGDPTTTATIVTTGWRFKCHLDKDARAVAADAAAPATRRPATRQGRAAPPDVPPPAGLQVLRREDRLHQLQGREAAWPVHPGARQDPAAPHFGRLRDAPARRCRRPSSARARSRSCRTSPTEERGDMSMEVILKEHVDHLGRRGEIVKVADGYARNYLLPRKLALPCTDENKQQIERERAKAEARTPRSGRPARRWPSGWRASRSSIARRVGENDMLYGSVTTSDIAEALAAKGFDRRSPQDPARRSAQDARRAQTCRSSCTATSSATAQGQGRRRGYES